MPEYLTPGVYVEEFEIGARPIEGVSTSTAGFLGFTERGPTKKPIPVTSVAQFKRIYGEMIPGFYLAYAVDGFFRNGGQRCYIGRIVRLNDKYEPSATAATIAVDGGKVDFTAVGEGEWGNRVAVRIDDATLQDPNENPKKMFRVTIAYWGKDKQPDEANFDIKETDADKIKKAYNKLIQNAMLEIFDNLSVDPHSPDYYKKQLGEPGAEQSTDLSNLIYMGITGTDRPANTEDGKKYFVYLKDGMDVTAGDPEEIDVGDFLGKADAKPGEKRGLTAFDDVDEISILYVPDSHKLKADGIKALYDEVLSRCENLKDRFAIMDVPQGQKDIDGIRIDTVARPSKYGAIYYPWIKVLDPLTNQMKAIPPGGHMAGIYARSDTERGVHKAPANEIVRGASDLEFSLTKGEQGILNPRGINVIRSFPGRGILVWGARNAIIDPLWKYINVRRLFIYIEESIEEGTQWVVFEPNNEKLWARVAATITEFLTRAWRDGALMGTKPEEAFFVKCDRSTMTQDDIDNGRLICVIGIAPVKPAEFVIFRIAQWASGSKVTE